MSKRRWRLIKSRPICPSRYKHVDSQTHWPAFPGNPLCCRHNEIAAALDLLDYCMLLLKQYT